MDLDKAVSAHVEWKTKLRAAISSKAQLDAATISKDNCCPLGMWLHGEAKAKFSRLAPYAECVGAHASFHREAGKVAELINRKKYTEAESAIGAGTPYAAASSAAGIAIGKLKKASSL